MPINGRKEWKDSNFVPPLPPNCGRSAGRPKQTRRREADEIQQKAKKKQKKNSMAHPKNQSSLKRQQHTLRCSNCGVEGHNKRACILKKISHNEDCSQGTTRQVPAQRVHKLHVRRKNTLDNLVGMTSTQELGQSSKVKETNFSYSALGINSFPLKSQFYEKGVQVSSSSTTLPPTMYEQLQQSSRVNEDIF